MTREEAQRYPFLVTRPITAPVDATTTTAGQAHHDDSPSSNFNFNDDVEMGEAVSLAPQRHMHTLPQQSDSGPFNAGVHSAEVVQYLAIDTNIFVNHLRLVKALYSFLEHPESTTSLRILVPTTVINELDKLAASDAVAGTSPEGEVRLCDLARMATAWLLQVCRKPKWSEGNGNRNRESRVRCQKWSEKLDQELRKPDDKILDCCLYFRQQGEGAPVKLWTNDQNLSLLAEVNDINTISGYDMSLTRMVPMLALPITPSLVDVIRTLDEAARAVPILDGSSFSGGGGGTAPSSSTMSIGSGMEVDVDSILASLRPENGNGQTVYQLDLTASSTPDPSTPYRQRSPNRSKSSSPTKRPTISPFSPPPQKRDSPTAAEPLIPAGHMARRLSPEIETAFKVAFSPFDLTSSPSDVGALFADTHKIHANPNDFDHDHHDDTTTTEWPTSGSTTIMRLVRNLLDRLVELESSIQPITSTTTTTFTTDSKNTTGTTSTFGIDIGMDMDSEHTATTNGSTEQTNPDTRETHAENHRMLIRCISSNRDVLHFLTPARFARTVRVGEVTVALEYLGDHLAFIFDQGSGSKEAFYHLAGLIRQLSW